MCYLKKVIILILVLLQTLPLYARVVNKVVAVVNDEVITQQDIDQMLAVIHAQYAHTYKRDELAEKIKEVNRGILKQMIEDKLILSRAKELKIDVTDEEIKEKLEYVKNGFPSEEDFYNLLKEQGITIGNLKDRYKDQIMMKKVVDLEVRSRVSVLPSEMAEYYETHRLEFKKDKKYRLRHILRKAEDDVSFELAKVEIEDIYNKLKEGEAFEEVARLYSQGPYKEEGGDMGYIELGDMLEGLGDAIAGLKPGEFSEPLKSHIGYHIFKVEDIRHSGYFTFEEVQNDIKMMLFQKKFKQRLRKWLGGLRKKAYISVK